MINAMSDLETDAATQEINAAKASPWPDDMRDQIWSDRLLLRFKMKKEMRSYREFLEGIVKSKNENDDVVEQDGEDNGNSSDSDDEEEEINIQDAIPILHQFCTTEITPKQLRSIFQCPRSELSDILKTKHHICSAYAILFCGVVEQVANFPKTKYGVDARCNEDGDNTEEIFEKELRFQKVGPGFCLNIINDTDGTVNDEVLTKFLQRMVSLAGPTLLARAPKVSHDNDDDDEGSDGGGEADGGASEEINAETNTPSFRSDRRVARLLIAKYWADRLMELYKQEVATSDEN